MADIAASVLTRLRIRRRQVEEVSTLLTTLLSGRIFAQT